ncbi:MAG: EamA/RhaT family transporter, partial [Flavobacteriales bacterium]
DRGMNTTEWRWPVMTFVASGFIDTSLNLFQLFLVNEEEFASLITVIFGFAFLAGLVHHVTFPDKRITKVSMSYGALLGIANFGSLIFLLLALHEPQWESSVVFPINNVGVVAGSTIAAVIVFKERMSIRKLGAIAIALLSIGVLYFS